jgi:hypothetical protein
MDDPTTVTTYDVPADDRARIRAALSHAQGFLAVGGLEAERDQAARVETTLDKTAADEAVRLREVDAARAVAALVAYKQHLLDEDEIRAAAEAEAAIRGLTGQDAALAAMVEDGCL